MNPSLHLLLSGMLAVTAEPDERGETTVGVNVAPVVVEWAATPRVGIRAWSLLNLQVSGAQTGLAQRGAGLAVPVYLPLKQQTAPAQGFYLGPFAAYAVNPLVDGADLSLGAEGGVRWLLRERVALNLALQGGASQLTRPDQTRWVSHLGVFPSVGVWW